MDSSPSLRADSAPEERSRARPLGLQERLIACAANQLGLFTVQQAAEAGVSGNALHWRKHAGLIVPVYPGVYRLTGVNESPRQRTLAACLSVPVAVVGGVSAAMVQGLPVGCANEGRPTLIVPHQTSLRRSGIDLHRTRSPFLTQPWHTVRITQVSSTLISLAGVLTRPELARCLDHAVAHRLVSVTRLLNEVASRPSARFVGRADLLAEIHARAGERVIHRSKYEQRVDRWLRQTGLPKPKTNYKVSIIGRDALVEVDFAWPEFRVALEVSPFFTHGSAATQRRDMQRRQWLQESRWTLVEASDDHLVNRGSFLPVIGSLALVLGLGANS